MVTKVVAVLAAVASGVEGLSSAVRDPQIVTRSGLVCGQKRKREVAVTPVYQITQGSVVPDKHNPITHTGDHWVRVTNHRIPDDKLEAAIFDFDGTIVDSMRAYFFGLKRTCDNWTPKLQVSSEDFYGYGGLTINQIITNIFVKNGLEAPSDATIKLFKQKEDEDLKEVRQSKNWPPGEINPVTDLIKEYHAQGIKLAIATSGFPQDVEEQLRRLGIYDYFEAMVFSRDVAPRGKPHPDIYLEAARRLNVSPNKCRVYEDGETGLLSGYRAEMEVIDVTYHPRYHEYGVEAMKSMDEQERIEFQESSEALYRAKGKQVALREWGRFGELCDAKYNSVQ